MSDDMRRDAADRGNARHEQNKVAQQGVRVGRNRPAGTRVRHNPGFASPNAAHLVVVPHDRALEFRRIDPGYEIFHVSIREHERGCTVTLDKGTWFTYLVTRYAGSVIVSGPTRTCPCSMNLTA